MSGLIPKKWLIFKNKSARRLSKDERLKYGSKAKYAPSWRNTFVTNILLASVLAQRRWTRFLRASCRWRLELDPAIK
ncbi:hypothetical protein J8TS2_30190 [Lederbergia ruris]|uniref:Uncharacterized protein n=1 Tax=Lederbergia ruris TaxID=217495 RepID=A0ABQ4KL79_9BACI|nr:hypothetical protein J8TS2_30190 [Lederbergia ruris]